MKYTQSRAVIEGRYRYLLERRWLGVGYPRVVCWVMFNPSTADGTEDDATIRRCVGFAASWGYDAIRVVNLFALRSRNPPHKYCDDLVGDDNDFHIGQAVISADLIVCAWGAFEMARDRAVKVVRLIESVGGVPHALKLSAGGMPVHPLFQPKGLRPFSIYGWPAKP